MASNVSGSGEMITWLRERVELSTFEPSMWTAEHDATCIQVTNKPWVLSPAIHERDVCSDNTLLVQSTCEHSNPQYCLCIQFLSDVTQRRLLMVIHDGALVLEYKGVPPIVAASDELMCVSWFLHHRPTTENSATTSMRRRGSELDVAVSLLPFPLPDAGTLSVPMAPN